MTTLAKRATPRQAVVMRIVAGAVRNAAHAHPKWNIPPKAANSIAKRAAGTLTAGWPDVLAAPRASSEQGSPHSWGAGSASCGHVATAGDRERGIAEPRSPLVHLHNAVGSMAAEAKRTMQFDRHAALVDVLRLIVRIT